MNNKDKTKSQSLFWCRYCGPWGDFTPLLIYLSLLPTFSDPTKFDQLSPDVRENRRRHSKCP